MIIYTDVLQVCINKYVCTWKCFRESSFCCGQKLMNRLGLVIPSLRWTWKLAAMCEAYMLDFTPKLTDNSVEKPVSTARVCSVTLVLSWIDSFLRSGAWNRVSARSRKRGRRNAKSWPCALLSKCTVLRETYKKWRTAREKMHIYEGSKSFSYGKWRENCSSVERDQITWSRYTRPRFPRILVESRDTIWTCL